MGKIGGMLHDYAAGLDDSPVRRTSEVREIKSVGNGLTFSRNLEGWEDIRLGLTILADEVATRLRRQGLLSRTVQLTIKDPALKTITRQRPLPRPTNLARELVDTCLSMMQACWNEHSPVRMLTITAQQLTEEEGGEQLSFFEPEAAIQHEKRADWSRRWTPYGTNSAAAPSSRLGHRQRHRRGRRRHGGYGAG